MKIPNETVNSQTWRITEIAPDFRLLDVWALPAEGGPDQFPELLEVMNSIDPAGDSILAKFLWRLRDEMGRWLGLGRTSASTDHTADEEVLTIPGAEDVSVADRLPDDLEGSVPPEQFRPESPFTPLYVTGDESAAEISNKTVHGILHLGWVEKGDGRYQGQMSVYVKPRGRFGDAYMALIEPFRNWIVYPTLMKQIEKGWNERAVAEAQAA